MGRYQSSQRTLLFSSLDESFNISGTRLKILSIYSSYLKWIKRVKFLWLSHWDWDTLKLRLSIFKKEREISIRFLQNTRTQALIIDSGHVQFICSTQHNSQIHPEPPWKVAAWLRGRHYFSVHPQLYSVHIREVENMFSPRICKDVAFCSVVILTRFQNTWRSRLLYSRMLMTCQWNKASIWWYIPSHSASYLAVMTRK